MGSGEFENVPEEKLREIKLGYRAKTIKRIDDNFRVGLIDEERLRNQPIETQKETLLDLWWKRKNEKISWLEKLIRL